MKEANDQLFYIVTSATNKIFVPNRMLMKLKDGNYHFEPKEFKDDYNCKFDWDEIKHLEKECGFSLSPFLVEAN